MRMYRKVNRIIIIIIIPVELVPTIPNG